MSSYRGSFDQGDENSFQAPSQPTAGGPVPRRPAPAVTGNSAYTANETASPEYAASPTSQSFQYNPSAEYGEPSRTFSMHSSNSLGRKRSLLSRLTQRSSNKDDEKHEDGNHLLETVPEADNEEDTDETDVDDDEIIPDLKQVVSQLQSENYMPVDANGDLAAAVPQKKSRGYGANRARRKKTTKAATKAGKAVKKLRKFYNAFLNKSLLTRAFIYWLPLAVILFIPLAVGAWRNPNLQVGHTSVMWLFIWLEVVWGSLWVTRIISHYLPVVIAAILGVIAPLWVKYTSILAAMEMATTYVLWTFVSFISFTPLLSLNHQAWSSKSTYSRSWQKIVNNIMVALFITSLVYFAERLLIHFLSVSFHRTRFAGRIKTNKEQVRLLGTLLQASYSVFPQYSPEFYLEDTSMSGGGTAAINAAAKRIPMMRNGSSQNLEKIVGNFNRVVGTAANAIGGVVKDIRGGKNKQTSQQVVSEALVHKFTSRVLANRIWKSLVMEDSDCLKIDDLVDVIGGHSRIDCEEIFNKLDGDGNGDLTLEEMETAVVEIGRERKIIYRSLRDVDSAIGKLHSVLLFVVAIISIIIFIGMLAPSVGTVLATLGTTLLALSFVFSATAQEILAACVFLFVKHPLDVGDVVRVLLPQGVTQMIVAEVSLLYTTFTDYTNGCYHQSSNAVLNTLWIDNISRSGNWSELVQLNLGLPETKMEDIEKFKELLRDFCARYNREYVPNPFVYMTNITDLDRVTLTICVTMRGNIADAIAYGNRREKLSLFIGQAIHDIPLHVPRRDETYNNPSLPMFTQPFGPSTVENETKRIVSEEHAKTKPAMGARHNFSTASIVDPQDDEVAIQEDANLKVPDIHDAHTNQGSTTALERSSSMVSRTASKSRGFRKKSFTQSIDG